MFVHSRKSSFISPVGIAGCVSVENQEKNMTHVCVGKKSLWEGEKKMVGKSFWGRVHTCWRKRWRTSHTRFCCVSHRETQCSLSGFFLLIQHTRRYFVKFFFFPKVFFLFRLCLKSLSVFGSGFCWIRGPSNTARKAERLAHTRLHRLNGL